MKNKKIIFTILLLFWMGVIFCFSNQNAKDSQNISDGVAIKTIEIKTEVIKKEVTESEKENFVETTRVLIRKSAHFTIYFVLGILLYLTFKSYDAKHPFAFSILLGFLYACSDEFHQLFVSERSARGLDVLIDTCGVILGAGILSIFKKNIKKRNILKNN